MSSLKEIILQQILTFSDEEIERGYADGMPAEHVVTTRPHSRQSHTHPHPYLYGTLQLGPHISIYLQ